MYGRQQLHDPDEPENDPGRGRDRRDAGRDVRIERFGHAGQHETADRDHDAGGPLAHGHRGDLGHPRRVSPRPDVFVQPGKRTRGDHDVPGRTDPPECDQPACLADAIDDGVVDIPETRRMPTEDGQRPVDGVGQRRQEDEQCGQQDAAAAVRDHDDYDDRRQQAQRGDRPGRDSGPLQPPRDHEPQPEPPSHARSHLPQVDAAVQAGPVSRVLLPGHDGNSHGVANLSGAYGSQITP